MVSKMEEELDLSTFWQVELSGGGEGDAGEWRERPGRFQSALLKAKRVKQGVRRKEFEERRGSNQGDSTLPVWSLYSNC